jgi:hypothetical protein
MCFGGSGGSGYVKKDYGALPSLGTGSASKTVTLNEAPAPMRGSRTGSGSYEANSPINISTGSGSRSSSSIGSIRPPTKTPNLNYTPKKNTLLRSAYLSVTSPFIRG